MQPILIDSSAKEVIAAWAKFDCIYLEPSHSASVRVEHGGLLVRALVLSRVRFSFSETVTVCAHLIKSFTRSIDLHCYSLDIGAQCYLLLITITINE